MSMWVCPCCNKANLDYDSAEFYDDQCYFPRECQSCWATWEEWYSMDFIWHENVNIEDSKLKDELFDYLNNRLFTKHSELIKAIEDWIDEKDISIDESTIWDLASDFISSKELYDLDYDN